MADIHIVQYAFWWSACSSEGVQTSHTTRSQQFLFHLLNREAEGQERCFLDLSVQSRSSHRDREVVRLDHLVLTCDGKSFDYVVQLPDVVVLV